MKFHPGCEWLCISCAPFQLLTCPLWNSIQAVSGCALPGPHFNCWHASIKSHLGCECLCISWASFQLLTCFHGIPSRLWVAVHLLGPISIADMPSIQWMSTSWALFQLLICPYKIPSSKWVAVHLVSISIANICTMKFHSVSEWLCTS